MHFKPRRLRLGRRQVVPFVWVVAAISVVVLGLGMTGTLAGFTASITNNANSAGTGSVLMTETSGATTCYSNGATSTATITTNANNCPINKLGGNLAMSPGTTSTVNVTLANSGTLPVSTAFTLTPGGCSQSANGSPSGGDTSFCGVVDVAIWDSSDGKCIVPASAGTSQASCVPSSSNTLTSLGTTAIDLKATTGAIAAGGSRTFSILTEIDPANATNADMNLQVSDNLAWSFTA
jgi:hypothetical protein